MGRVRQNLSADSIFNFMSNREHLVDTLRSGFLAMYCNENYPILEKKFAIPMKCFCDIPLGMIKRHLTRFGKYGIGVTKRYAIENGITPVSYVHKKSQNIWSVMDDIFMDVEDGTATGSTVLPYFKWYEEKTEERKYPLRYYDEREWRWVPEGKEIKEGFSKGAIKELNKNIVQDKGLRLDFGFSDISYIFVRDEEDVKPVIEAMRRIRKFRNDDCDADILISKIITAAQIEFDF